MSQIVLGISEGQVRKLVGTPQLDRFGDRYQDASRLSSVDKAMLLLVKVLTQDAPMSLTDLCRSTGLTKPTVHRLLAILQRYQMVARLDTTYVPGEYLSTTGNWPESKFVVTLRRQSSPYLLSLHRLTGAAASVSVRTMCGSYQVNEVIGHRNIPFVADDAGSAVGKIFDASRDDIVLAAGSPDTPELLEIRRTGLAYSYDRPRALTAVAVLMPGCCEGQLPVALAVTGVPSRVDLLSTTKTLRRSAIELSRAVSAAMSVSTPSVGSRESV